MLCVDKCTLRVNTKCAKDDLKKKKEIGFVFLGLAWNNRVS